MTATPPAAPRRTGLVTVLLLGTIAVWFTPAAVAAAEPFDVVASDPVLEPANWIRFDTHSGVAGRIRGYHLEPGGSLWLATERGLQHYDGLRWTTWTEADGLPDDQLSGLAFAADGSLWVSFLDAGVARLDGDRWVTYGLEDGLRSLRMGGIHRVGDDLWVDYRADELGQEVHAVSRLRGYTWETLDLPPMEQRVWVAWIHTDADGALWLSTSAGVLRRADDTWTRFTGTDGAPSSFTLRIHEDGDGSLWFACPGEGLFRYDGHRWQQMGEADGIDASFEPATFWRAADGRLWLGGRAHLAVRDGEGWHVYPTDAYPGRSWVVGDVVPGEPGFWVFDWFTPGFFRFDPGRSAQRFTHPEGLAGGVEGPDGSVWFRTGQIDGTVNTTASPGRRAVRYRDGQWTAYDGDDGFFDDAVYSVTRTADGDVWYVGRDGGATAVHRLSRDGWHYYAEGLPDPASAEPANAVAHPSVQQTDDGRVWLLGGYEGGAAISSFDGTRWTRQVLADSSLCEWASQILRTSDGDLWVSCGYPSHPEPDRDGALLHYDGQTWQAYTRLDGLPSTYITGLAEWPPGTLNVGTIAGFSTLDLGAGEATWQNKTDFDVTRPKPRSMLPSDDGLWYAFMANRFAGVVRYDGTTHHRITMDQGLVDNDVSDIQRLADGALWFLTRGGLSRYDGQRWLSYGTDRGLPGGGPFPTMQQMADGSLWLDNGDGTVTHFRPPLGRGLPVAAFADAPTAIDADGNVRLSWSGVDSGNATVPAALRYQWRLDGDDWSPPSTTRQVTLTALRHGAHTLEVRALDDDGNLSAAPATHTFTVAAPWWLNPWVVTATAVFVGLIALQTGRVVRRDHALHAANAQLREANRAIQLADGRKSQFLASMSHELRTPMNAIIGFTRLALRRSGDGLPARQRQNLEKVEASADHLLGLINDLLDLSKIEAGRMDVSLSTFDVRRLVDACCASVDSLVKAGAALRAEVGDSVTTMTSDEVKVRQIVVNLLGNALKFTDHGEVTVRVERQGETLVAAVADTGIGIPAAELETIFEEFHQVGSAEREDRGTGLGLAITRRFVELLGGTIAVDSTVGVGTTFTVRLPVEAPVVAAPADDQSALDPSIASGSDSRGASA